GPILGLFLLNALARRVGPRGALAGVTLGVLVMTLVWLWLRVSWQWYVLIGATVTFASGVTLSALLGERGQTPASAALEADDNAAKCPTKFKSE
ncbi:MAG: hypothetical protein N3I86_16615, partial [Verrucomicrobiae bacterium]|nr:hypothetical protein [Verrucomicrobiae bacterium]